MCDEALRLPASLRARLRQVQVPIEFVVLYDKVVGARYLHQLFSHVVRHERRVIRLHTTTPQFQFQHVLLVHGYRYIALPIISIAHQYLRQSEALQ